MFPYNVHSPEIHNNNGYTIGNQLISKFPSIIDLGIIQDSKLLYNQHVDETHFVVKKVTKAVGVVIGTTTSLCPLN